jgi:hypothetical protein
LVQLALACGAVLHAVAHAPQWLGVLFRSTHAPAQFFVPLGQLEVHMPCVHTSLEAHVFAHAPQLLGSLSVFTHALSHLA